jgi:hypothetical protein
MTMLTDGIKSKSLEDEVKQLDVAELLERACAVEEAAAGEVTPPAEVPSSGPEQAPEANAE